MTDRSKVMGTEKVGTLLRYYSLPAIAGMMVSASYSLVNRVFVGHAVGGVAIAAITVSFPIFVAFIAFSMLIGFGAATLISIRLGQKQKEEAERILGNALSLLIILPTSACLIMYYYIEPILMFLGATEHIFNYAASYLKILMPAMVLMSVSVGLNNVIRAEGYPVTAMLTQLLGGAVNVVFNYVFVILLDWGIQGAALGAVLGQVFTIIWVMVYLLHPGRTQLKIHLIDLIPHPAYLCKIAAIGLAPFVLQIGSSLQHLMINRALSEYGGASALATIGIISALSQFLIMPMVGLSQGVQPIISYNYGAQLYERAHTTLKIALLYATAFSVLAWFIIQLFTGTLVGIFLAYEPETTALASHAASVFFALLFMVGIHTVISGYFQAIGKPVQATFLSLSRQVIFFIPLLFILPHFWGLDGIWRATPLADLAAVLAALICMYAELHHSRMLRFGKAGLKTASDLVSSECTRD